MALIANVNQGTRARVWEAVVIPAPWHDIKRPMETKPVWLAKIALKAFRLVRFDPKERVKHAQTDLHDRAIWDLV